MRPTDQGNSTPSAMSGRSLPNSVFRGFLMVIDGTNFAAVSHNFRQNSHVVRHIRPTLSAGRVEKGDPGVVRLGANVQIHSFQRLFQGFTRKPSY